jgi:hypothetical protein
VPLRILGVGLTQGERVAADVFLLTDQKPSLLPGDNAPGLALARQEKASPLLLTDLRTDKGMGWVPASSWLTYLKVDAAPTDLTYDLAVDASGAGKPSAEATGLVRGSVGEATGSSGNGGGVAWPITVGAGLALVLLVAGIGLVVSREGRSTPKATA